MTAPSGATNAVAPICTYGYCYACPVGMYFKIVA